MPHSSNAWLFCSRPCAATCSMAANRGSAYWDDPERMRLLLPLSVTVLAELAGLGGFEADYTGYC
jgi:hypothetical protein